MTAWDLSRIQYTVRKLTGKFDVNQLPNDSPLGGEVSVSNPPGINDYINDFYLYDMPEHLRTLKLKQFYEFTTLPNCGKYNLPPNILQVEPPAYVDGYQSGWWQSAEAFYGMYPDFLTIRKNIVTGDGTDTYTFTIPAIYNTPPLPPYVNPNYAILQGSVVIGIAPNIGNMQLETFTDIDTPILLDQPTLETFSNPGALTGNLGGTGTIDYLTGAVVLNYASPVPIGAKINVHYKQYVPSRPMDILLYQSQLVLRPIPDDVYRVKIQCYLTPTVAIDFFTKNTTPANVAGTTDQFTGTPNLSGELTQVPLWAEWFQLICYGTALKILIEEGDWDEVARLQVMFDDQKVLAQRRLLKQLSNQRIPTQYMANSYGGQGGQGSNWPYPLY